ncbi:MAG: type II secretion system protein GspN [Deltaproteobacteria bacterium]|nr:type II secretion system protein GspN [Deltaproteobacteria bacterium]
MGRPFRIIAYGALVFSSLALSAGIAFYLVPDEAYENYIEDALEERTSLKVELDGLRKTLPFSFRASSIKLSGRNGLLVEINDPDLRPRLSLPLGLAFSGAIGGGEVDGRASIWPLTGLLVKAEGVDAGSLPFLSSSGLVEGGIFNANARISAFTGCPEGEIEARASGLRLKSRIDPLLISRDGVIATLTAGLRDCSASVRSLSIEGKDLSARAYGDVDFRDGRNELDLTIELTPSGALNETAALILSDYRKSANYFTMRVKGPLSNPALSEAGTI